MRNAIRCFNGLAVGLAATCAVAASAAEDASVPAIAPIAEPFVAVPDATVWPNLTRLQEGAMLLAGFNKPSHGQVEGDVACWVSQDEGATWTLRSNVTQHTPDTVRMNQAVGLDRHGNVVALVGGWTDVQQPDAPKRGKFRDAILGPWVCVSEDGGKSWRRHADFPPDPEGRPFVAFGDIVLSEDGRLNASAYSTSYYDKPGPWAAYFLVSEDDGETWQIRSKITTDRNETALLYLGDGAWLAAIRGKATTLCRSTDDGLTWENTGDVTQERQYPAHLLRLNDDRILLTYGDRRKGSLGVGARISPDEGRSWGAPLHLASMPESDGGYPASLQRVDGQILTLFYAKAADSYAARALIWDPE